MGVDELARLIERWWELEADYTANCVARDPALCQNHVMEEAVRGEDGSILACTVHGGRLARSLAAFLVAESAEREARVREAFRETFPPRLSVQLPPELTLNGLRGAPTCVAGCDFPVSGYHAKRGGRVLCSIQHVQGCGGADPGKRCICPGERERSP